MGIVAGWRRVRRWRLFGVLVAGLVNALLWQQGYSVLPNVGAILLAACTVAVAAGLVTQEAPVFTAVALAAGTPFPFGHVPLAMGLIPVYVLAAVIQSLSSLEAVEGAMFGLALFSYGFAFVFAPQWLLVQIGWQSKLWFSRRQRNRPRARSAIMLL